MMNSVLLVPVYNHGEPFGELVGELDRFDLPVIVVDDGSNRQTRVQLQRIARDRDSVTLLQHRQNRGKGAAIRTGLRFAVNHGWTHALQIDADHQHDPSDIPVLLEQSRQHPDALVLGIPSFDETIPTHRYYFRYLTHVWIWVETMSFVIPDALCGFRVYPVRRSLDVLRTYELGHRMAFDPGFAVRFYWDGGDIRTVETTVTYPPDHHSNYNPIADTVRISWMHFRSVMGMLYRFPELLRRTCSAAGTTPDHG